MFLKNNSKFWLLINLRCVQITISLTLFILSSFWNSFVILVTRFASPSTRNSLDAVCVPYLVVDVSLHDLVEFVFDFGNGRLVGLIVSNNYDCIRLPAERIFFLGVFAARVELLL